MSVRSPAWLGKLARGTTSRVEDAVRSTRTARAIAELEDRVWAFRRDQKIGRGTLRSTFVVAYRGYVANQLSTKKAFVRVRVMEEPILPATDALPNAALLRANVRRFVAMGFPGVHVRLAIGEFVADAITDRHGFATAQLPVVDLEPGWAEYECQTMPVDPTEEPIRAVGQVSVPDPRARIGVVSDVDDTVLRTGMSEGFVAIRNTLLRAADTRRAVPGMAELYRALQSPRDDDVAGPAFYYVSTGPWNLYDVLTDFLRIRGFPDGPLFLTDWAPQERFVVRSGPEHKRVTVQRIFEAYPDTRFVLVGDSGQKDPETYVDIAREWPDQVEAIVIRDVGEHLAQRADQLRANEQQWRDEGIPFDFAHDAESAAQALADRGLLDEEAVGRVSAAAATDDEGCGNPAESSASESPA